MTTAAGAGALAGLTAAGADKTGVALLAASAGDAPVADETAVGAGREALAVPAKDGCGTPVATIPVLTPPGRTELDATAAVATGAATPLASALQVDASGGAVAAAGAELAGMQALALALEGTEFENGAAEEGTGVKDDAPASDVAGAAEAGEDEWPLAAGTAVVGDVAGAEAPAASLGTATCTAAA